MATVDGGDVRFTFTGDSSDLNDSLKDIERNLESVADAAQGVSNDLGKDLKSSAKDAQSAAKGLESQTKKNARAFADTKKQTDAAAKSLERTSDAAGETDSILKGLAGALGIVSPEASAAATALGDAAGGLEAVARVGASLLPILAPVGAAVAVLAVAFADTAREIENAKAIQDTYAAAAMSLEGTERALEDAVLDRAAALGILTEAELRQAQASLTAQRAVLEFAAAQSEQRKEVDEASESAEKWLGIFDRIDFSVGGATTAVADSIFGWTDAIDTAKAQTDILNDALLEEVSAQKELRAVLEDTAVIRDAATSAERDATAAARSQADAVRDLATAEADAEEFRLATVALKQAEARRVAGEQANQEAAAAAAASAAAKRSAAILAAEEANRQALMATAGAYGDIGGAVSSLADTIAQGSEANKQAALVAFGVAKAAALAEGAVNVALSVTRAAAAAPPPANIPFIVAAAAQGAALIGGIAAQPPPQFPMGSFGIGAPTSADHQAVSIRQDEAILNSGARAELGDDTIRRLNRGQGAGGTTVQPVLLPGTVRGFVRDETRRSGALRSNGRRGNLSGNRGF